ncbi:hypothetical protein [Pseudochryseolinea flava]|uniref:Uncharacterized protein n=1 Tax=Pseudochryseolinea flava TaxID=2059302 RepID=A0A364Y8I2_9BACT|nr:hypothetical protein [Pseudochryseolinea flava]RAW02542.1 hypothetical protein DQQ10_00020 [Pseudochryseolinea flava]
MLQGIQLIEWIVKTAIMDESISTAHLVSTMKQNGITSTQLMNYVREDSFWPLYKSDAAIPEKDEKYILNLRTPQERNALKAKREMILDAIERRFYTGHKFNEWMI